MNRQKLLQVTLGILLILPFLFHAGGMLRLGFIQQLEDLAYDFRLNLSLPGEIDERIVIVDIDERSLAEVGRWPWSRDRMADMVDALFDDYAIDTLGFDIVFAERDSGSALAELEHLAEGPLADETAFLDQLEQLRDELDHERRFAEALAGRKVVMGYFFRRTIDDTETDPRSGRLPEPADIADAALLEQLPLPRPRGYGANLPELQAAARSGGFFDNPLVSADGVFRRVPALQHYNGAAYPMFSLEVARIALGAPPLYMEVESDPGSGYLAIEALHLGEHRIPVDRESGLLVPYRGAQGSFPYVSAHDVLERRVDPETLRDRIVLVGTTAAGLLDLRTTPVQNVFPGVEIHANVISGIIDQTIGHRPAWSAGYEFLAIAIVGLLAGALFPALSPLATTIGAALLATLLAGANMAAWQQAGLALPIASILLLLFVLYVFHVAWGYFVETRGKRRLAHLFGQYVPPELVREMDDRRDEISLQGESRELTVLFSDVRGFTTLSEQIEPAQLTDLMNEYLTPMTRTIHRHRGTIDKYIGDAIMAFWGAPLPDPEHARHALDAALDMLAELESINARFHERGWPAIDIGIGLNSGLMNVGNMGSEFRMSYTVLGDAVNLGSRLEGLTKAYGVRLLASGSVLEQAPEYAAREIDRVRVKGRAEPVTIHEPLGLAERVGEQRLAQAARHRQALAAYRRQAWDEAEAIWRALAAELPDERLYPLYLERIAIFRDNPPGPDWDGVFTHEGK